jgi:ketosteroid isomerase-like protein
MGLTGDEVYRGVEDVSRAMASWLGTWESFVVEAEEFIESDDCVIVLTRLRARAKGSSADIESLQADSYTFRDGKIVRIENTSRAEVRARADN